MSESKLKTALSAILILLIIVAATFLGYYIGTLAR